MGKGRKGKSSNNNQNGMKAVYILITVLGALGGFYTLLEPMSQRIDFLSAQMTENKNSAALDVAVRIGSVKEQIEKIEKSMALDNIRERTDRDEFARVSVEFEEVETQLRGLCVAIESRLDSLEETVKITRHSSVCAALLKAK